MKFSNLFDNKKYEKDLGYSIETLMKLFDHFSDSRLPYERLWKVLDSYDTGDFWNYVAKVLPKYSLRPDTNWINWIKENYVNSLYVGTYRGDVFCRNAENELTTLAINEFLEYIFNKTNFQSIQYRAGERASLLNFGAIELGWNADIIDGQRNQLFTGDIEVKNIDNLSLFLDPSATDYRKGKAIFIAEEVSIVELMNEPAFKKRLLHFINDIQNSEEYKSGLGPREYGRGYYGQRSRQDQDGTLRLLTCFYKYFDKENGNVRLDKIWIIEDGYVLAVQKGLKPAQFPVKVLYSSQPTKDPYGTPKTKLVLNNAMTLNLLDAIDSTMVFKALQRAKVISRKAGINEALFAKEGDNPNKLWVVDGDPNSVVRYVDLPNLPADRELLKQRLTLGIMRITGIDDVYTGSDTNSVQTTGGMDLLNQRVTIRDNSRIQLLGDFIQEVTEYIMSLYLENSGNRNFPKYNMYNELEEVKDIKFEDFREQDLKFDFTCNITPNLPNNVQRRAETMNIMMEKQMQYGFNPAIITAEDWLRAQDFPDKYKMLQRIRQQRLADDVEDIESEIINYAGLTQKGVRPEQAIKMLASERQTKRDNPNLGNTGNAGSFQNSQMG